MCSPLPCRIIEPAILTNANPYLSQFALNCRFDTEEKCTAGVCDQDPGGWMGLTEEECVQTASCSNWNCLGCERNNWEAPDSVCWIPTTSDGEAMTETLCGHQNYTGTWKEFTGDGQTFHACVKDENQGPGESLPHHRSPVHHPSSSHLTIHPSFLFCLQRTVNLRTQSVTA